MQKTFWLLTVIWLAKYWSLVFTLSLIVKCFNFAEFEFWGGNQDKELGKFWGKKLLCRIYGVRIFKMSFYFFARSL